MAGPVGSGNLKRLASWSVDDVQREFTPQSDGKSRDVEYIDGYLLNACDVGRTLKSGLKTLPITPKNEAVALRVLEEFRVGVISRRQAADLLECSERAVARRTRKLRSKGTEGIKHGNYQKPALNRIDPGKREQMLKLAKESYFDFNMVNCLEMLKERHGLTTSYSTFQRWCSQAGIGKHRQRRTSKARVHRERMSCEGLLPLSTLCRCLACFPIEGRNLYLTPAFLRLFYNIL